MIKMWKSFTLIAMCLWLTGCSSVKVTTDYDKSTSFTQYRTYRLVPLTEKIGLSPSSENAFVNTLRATLAARNLSEVSEDADLNVVRYISTREKEDVYQSGYQGIPYRYGRYRTWVGAPVTYTNVRYTEGTLILDFVDAKTQKLVFRGTATGTVTDPDTNAERIKEAVEKIVQQFPIPNS